MPRQITLLLVAACVLGLLAGPAAAQASAGPQAAASKACSLAGKTRSLGPTYTTSLSVRNTTCRRGRRLVKAYYQCRIDNGGRKGRCGGVLGYSCSERRFNVIPTQFDARVTCKRGAKRVKHTYTQYT
jgi:hypothetical protein